MLKDRITLLLIFLFPIAGNSLRSWTGVFFVLLFLWALYCRPWRDLQLEQFEKTLLFTLLLLFLIMIMSSYVNGWTYLQTKGLGTQIRLLAIIPIYFLIRKNIDLLRWFIGGVAVAGVVLGLTCIEEVFLDGGFRAYGVYDSPGLVAGQGTVFSILLIYTLISKDCGKLESCILVLGLAFSVVAILLSGSRSTYFALIVFLLLAIPLLFKARSWIGRYLSFIVACFGLIFYSVPTVNHQVKSGYAEVKSYFELTDPIAYNSHGSVGSRLELWRASIVVSSENFVLGVGWRNFPGIATSFANQGKINVVATQHPHPHNTYLEFLVSYGVFGLCTLVFFLFCSFKHGNTMMRTFVLFYLINGIHEGGLYIYGNSVSFFLLVWAILLASSLRRSAL